MKIFPEAAFTSSEMQEIATHLTNPSVRKYLNSLAYNAGKDICTAQQSPEEADHVFLRKIEYVKGGLGVLETLLNVEAAVG